MESKVSEGGLNVTLTIRLLMHGKVQSPRPLRPTSWEAGEGVPWATSGLQSSDSPLQSMFLLETLEGTCDLMSCHRTPECVFPTNKGIVSHPHQDTNTDASQPPDLGPRSFGPPVAPALPFTTGRVGGQGIQASTSRTRLLFSLGESPSILPQGGFPDVSSPLAAKSQELSHQGPDTGPLVPPHSGPPLLSDSSTFLHLLIHPCLRGLSLLLYSDYSHCVITHVDARIDPDSVTGSLSKLAPVSS